MTTSWRDLQTRFFDSLVSAGQPPPGVTGAFSVYVEGFALRRREAIETDFPATLQLLGAGAAALLEEFLRSSLGLELDLNAYGKAWYDFLKTQSGIDAMVVDLARYEWYRLEAVYREDDRIHGMPRLILSEDPRIQIQLVPGLRVEAFDFPVQQLRLNRRPVERQSVTMAIWAHGGHASGRSLDLTEQKILDLLREATDGPGFLAAVGSDASLSAEDLQHFMAMAVADGLVRLS